MTGARDVLTAAVTAARSGDLDRLRGLVDWPLTGAGQVAQALPDVLERDRAEVAASGLAELDAAATDASVVDEIIPPLAERLANEHEVRAADVSTTSAALAALQVPPPPPGLSEAQRERLIELSARAAALTDVYVIVDDQGEMPVVVAADAGRLVLVLD